jgi:predicted PhzF superfamily epimerase YddE/YHI9
VARAADHVVQQCGIGLVTVKRDGRRLAFAAPPLRRTGPLAPELRRQIAAVLRIAESEIRDHQWVDNGPGWCAVLLGSGAQVRSLKPDFFALGDLKLGVVAPQTGGEDTAFEVRALFAGIGEDPVTGSLNAGLAQWLIGAGLAPERYVAAQGHALQRAGRVFVQREGDGRIWIGGEVTPVIEGIDRL